MGRRVSKCLGPGDGGWKVSERRTVRDAVSETTSTISLTYGSNVSEATVRMADTASVAKDALLANLLTVSSSSFDSRRMRA